jgi:hypothetical protein
VPIVTIRKDAIATAKQQGKKVFTLQTIALMAEQGLASGTSNLASSGSIQMS